MIFQWLGFAYLAFQVGVAGTFCGRSMRALGTELGCGIDAAVTGRERGFSG